MLIFRCLLVILGFVLVKSEYAKICNVVPSPANGYSFTDCETIDENFAGSIVALDGAVRAVVCGDDAPMLARLPSFNVDSTLLESLTVFQNQGICQPIPHQSTVSRRGDYIQSSKTTFDPDKTGDQLDLANGDITVGFACGPTGCGGLNGLWAFAQQVYLTTDDKGIEYRATLNGGQTVSSKDYFRDGCPDGYSVNGYVCQDSECSMRCVPTCEAGKRRYLGSSSPVCSVVIACDTDETRCPHDSRREYTCPVALTCKPCKEKFENDDCGACAPGYYGEILGCLTCTCRLENAVSGACGDSGVCIGECKPGWLGVDCSIAETNQPTGAPSASPTMDDSDSPTSAPTVLPVVNVTVGEANSPNNSPPNPIFPVVSGLLSSLVLGVVVLFVAYRRSRLLAHARMLEVDGDGMTDLPEAIPVTAIAVVEPSLLPPRKSSL